MSDGLGVISTFPFSVESQEGKDFGMRVLTMRHSFLGETHDADVDQFYPLGRLHDMLHESDYVVPAVPFAENLRRYRAGEVLRNRYDPERGY